MSNDTLDPVADDRYPEILRDLAEQSALQLVESGIEAEQARAIAGNIAERIRGHWGGQLVYIAKGDGYERRKVWAEMWRQFDGTNHAELGRRFGYGTQAVYKILRVQQRAAQARQQPELFDSKETAA